MAGDGAPWDAENAGLTSAILGAVGWLLFLFGVGVSGDPWNAFLLPALVFALLAIALGARGLPSTTTVVGGVMGRSLAVVGIVLGIAYLGLGLLLPLLFLLFLVLFGWSFACNAQANGPPPERERCCGPCCDACDQCCADCGRCPGSCCEGCGNGCAGCGGCGDCGCGGGGCGCALLGTGVLAGQAVQHAPPLGFADAYAHHPDAPGFEQDVYRVRGMRLCIGCFTTYPVFLAAVAALLVAAPLPGPWWAWVLGGLGAASAQALSSAGLAKRRWMKATVKTLLGAGLAAFVLGALASPLPDWAQAGMLLLALGAASLSTLPRTLRMRKARAAGCQCQAQRVKAA
jgi:hypothetical protein